MKKRIILSVIAFFTLSYGIASAVVIGGSGPWAEKSTTISATKIVGIGSTTPYAKLTVQSTSGQTNDIFNVASSSGGSYFKVSADGTITAPGLTVAFDSASVNALINASTTIPNPYVETGDMMYFNGTDWLRVYPNTDSTVLKYLSQFNSQMPTWQTPAGIGSYTYYFTTAKTSPVANYLMNGASTTMASYTTGTVSATTTLNTYMTASSTPGITTIQPAMWHLHLDATKTSGTKELRFYAQVFKYNGTTETGLFTTQESQAISSTNVNNPEEVDIEFNGTTTISLLATDRLGVRLYATTHGVGTNPVGAYYTAGITQSRIELPANIVDATNFVPYSGATKDINIGTVNLTSLGISSFTNMTSTNASSSKIAITSNTGIQKANGTTKPLSDATSAEMISAIGYAPTFSGTTTASSFIATSTSEVSSFKGVKTGTAVVSDAATIVVNWALGSTQEVVLGSTGRTLSFQNVSPGSTLKLWVWQDGTGSRTITTYPTGVHWAGGTAPTLTTTANKFDMLVFTTASSTTQFSAGASLNY